MGYSVRRLTPLECERLQGFPSNWTLIGEKVGEDYYWTDESGKKRKTTDSARYKAMGNSIATGPNSFWMWILKRISAQYDRTPTMASLFSGIGGFDLAWSMINGDGTVLWSSEIDEFPVAVMKKHFGDDESGTHGDWQDYMRGYTNKDEGVF